MPPKKRLGKVLETNKEDAQFREALKLYESKQYRKALKILDVLLKKSPSAEAFSLKGLLLYNLNELTEAESYILKGIAKDDNNVIVNHISGIYYRAVNNLKEAAKWFSGAVEHGSSNKNILRDLSSVQSQIRDYKGLVKSRLAYLEDQPAYRANWTALATAYHLNKDHAAAERVLTKFENMVKGNYSEADLYEQSECTLYLNRIIGETGDHQRALDDLERIKDWARDGVAVLESKAFYLTSLGRNKEASVVYRELLQRNPDNQDYYLKLEETLGTTTKPVAVRKALYEKLGRFYPKSEPVKFIPLTFLTGDDFKQAAESYILSQLKRGVPSAFVNVKPLYRKKANVPVFLEIVTKFFENEAAKVSPLTWCWTAYYLALHHLHVKNLSKALEYINLAIDHTPTLVELYVAKARILKHFNKLQEAAEVMDSGRSLDLQDRFINSKATKYYLRANLIDSAVKTISLFTKNDEGAVNGIKDLHVMQSIWFITENGEAYYRLFLAKLAELEEFNRSADADDEETIITRNVLEDEISEFKALSAKRFIAITKIYDEFFSDQMDFHSYCMRRGTPRAYIDTIKWEDRLYGSPMYVRAIMGLAKIHLDVDRDIKEGRPFGFETAPMLPSSKRTKKAKSQNAKRREEVITKTAPYSEDNDAIGLNYIESLYKDKNGVDLLVPYYDKIDKELICTNLLGFKIFQIQKKYLVSNGCVSKLSELTNDKHPHIAPLLLELKLVATNDESIVAPLKKLLLLGLGKRFPAFAGEDESSKLVSKVVDHYLSRSTPETACAITEILQKLLEFVAEQTKSDLENKLEAIESAVDPYALSKIQAFRVY
ncbi:unnamed protein product [Kuraishia capsulata CBS 1993]|uniref:N-terminal acetyltransferase A, auxiliary subunit n=1 Tax=Kuraishia capsulata CBS 1993 TaxID=1382522 RepID=W6MJN4_9ASCO|nr:uncharacterized protein KUCA_T00000653001 [Kuraishia capsulata CBS 1993]CDK24687.1 unnamed protein product [Kuraishia capsulata CBS 1993]